MKRSPIALPSARLVALLLAGLMAGPMTAQAQEREDLEKMRATLLSLIGTLVKNGVMSRSQADAMMRDAQRAADVQLAAPPSGEIGPDGKKIVRVPYVPEAIRSQMREQITADVLASTRGAAGSGGLGLTEAGGRLQISGDVRLRAEAIRQGADNSPATTYRDGQRDLTRAADLWADPNINTQQGLERTRLRARLGFKVAVTETVAAGITLSTGGVTGPTSTNQTMATGSNQGPGFFNKYALVVDKAYAELNPLKGLRLSGGRMANPFVGTDLVWADDLNFEGFAASFQTPVGNQWEGFATAGWFPLAFQSPGQSGRRSLTALQGGVNWQFGQRANRLKLAVALYNYAGIEGVKETTLDKSRVPDYAVRSEYGAAYRQRGNTLFRINSDLAGDEATNWGLASGFRELDLTASLDLALFDPVHVVFTGDIVRNLAFSRDEVKRRTGLSVSDGSGVGYLAKVQLGMPVMRQAGDWNVSLGYRRLGSDAVLDAFTNSDFGRGGTNNKGFTLGGNWSFAKNAWLSARWMSSNLAESMVPLQNGVGPRTTFSVDTLQLELNARF
ncbi:MAG: putative porin [Aquabacterium sp.]|nr:putative porin [Aquabacterium sp.]